MHLSKERVENIFSFSHIFLKEVSYSMTLQVVIMW